MENGVYPLVASSNQEGEPGLRNVKRPKWKPNADDKSPSVRITINEEEDSFIESVTLTETTNVKSVTVVVVKADGSKVSCLSIFIHLQLIFHVLSNECP